MRPNRNHTTVSDFVSVLQDYLFSVFNILHILLLFVKPTQSYKGCFVHCVDLRYYISELNISLRSLGVRHLQANSTKYLCKRIFYAA